MTTNIRPEQEQPRGASLLAPAETAPEPPGPSDRSVLRLGTIAGAAGLVLQIVMEELHPARANPNNSAEAFREYAQSDIWTAVHIGQFAGTLLIVLALLALARTAMRQPGLAGALALTGAVTALLVAAVFTVQMAVDGVALKAAIDAWTSATGPDKVAAYQMADDIRSVEKGLGGFFQILNGLTLLAVGLSIALGHAFARWLGWVGAVGGLGWVTGGAITAHTGFSPQASTVLLGALVLTALFIVSASISMWRRSSRTSEPLATKDR